MLSLPFRLHRGRILVSENNATRFESRERLSLKKGAPMRETRCGPALLSPAFFIYSMTQQTSQSNAGPIKLSIIATQRAAIKQKLPVRWRRRRRTNEAGTQKHCILFKSVVHHFLKCQNCQKQKFSLCCHDTTQTPLTAAILCMHSVT